MLILYPNSDGKRISIEITVDHQLTGNRQCIGCTVTKSNFGWIKLIWPQGEQVKTQQNSILLIFQMCVRGYFVSDISKRHGEKQMIMTPNGVILPLVIKNGMTHLKYYHSTAKQMQDITQEEFMTQKNDQDLTQYDDIECAAELQIQQFLTTPIDTIDSFYDVKGNICAHKSDWEEKYILSAKIEVIAKKSLLSVMHQVQVVDLEGDPTVQDLKKRSRKKPRTKREVSQVVGFFLDR